MASPRLSVAGMQLVYAVETTAGTKPTTGYKTIPEIKSMPSFNDAPATLDTTTLLETEYKTSTPGLKDAGGAKEFGANLTDDLITFWDNLMTEHENGIKDGKRTWFAIIHPKLAKCVYFVGTPSAIGINEASVDTVLETTLYITPETPPEWGTPPTDTLSIRTSADVPIVTKSKSTSND